MSIMELWFCVGMEGWDGVVCFDVNSKAKVCSSGLYYIHMLLLVVRAPQGARGSCNV